jgi:hypothetical protein
LDLTYADSGGIAVQYWTVSKKIIVRVARPL